MIAEVIVIRGYTLMVYYCPDEVYRLSLINTQGTVFEFNDIFHSSDLALLQGRAIIKTIA